ncbi:hypothetical protein MA4S0303_0899 [Mycobacteroides abscessus 4S-0303]|nr:hypothetical protein MA4S0303_0899 [Mycobacteroides abscessus 4S-0303]
MGYLHRVLRRMLKEWTCRFVCGLVPSAAKGAQYAEHPAKARMVRSAR